MSIQPQLLQELDASVKSGFQSLRDSYFRDLIICTVALGVGVVAEELEYILEWRWFVRLIRVFSVRILSPKHRLDSWVRHVSMIGWIVVILGIAGEGLFETLVSRADGWLQDFSNIALAAAQRQVADAIGEAGRATGANAQLRIDLEQAKTKASTAQRLLSKQLAESAGQIAEAKKQVNEELMARLKLEAQLINVEVCNAPRVIPSWSASGKTGTDPLRPLSGTIVFIEVVADGEAQRAALNIAGVLSDAKWDVKSLTVVNGNGIKDGVDVQPYQGSHPQMAFADWEKVTKAGNIADALVDFLHSYNWQAQRGWPIDATGKLIRDDSIIPPGSVRIRVGLYPAVMYIPPPGLSVLSVALAKNREEFEKASQQSRRRTDEQFRKMLDSLPPDQRKRAEQSAKEFEEDRKKAMSRYKNPCQSFLTWSPQN